MSQLHRAIMAASVFVAALFALPAQAVLLGPFGGTWDGSESTMAARLFRDLPGNTCTTPQSPGVFSGSQYFETFSFLNAGTTAQCVTVSVNEDLETFISAYLGSFDPTNLVSNFLGDQGGSGTNTFSFEVPAGAEFVIMASTVRGGNSIGHFYSFEMRGDNLEPGDGTVPIPEPATLALLGLGLAGIGFSRRKQI